MKTMAPMIAAKNMAGKETVDSSMFPACSLRRPLHNAILCANRWFCGQRQHDHKARPKHWRPLSVSLTHPFRRANGELRAFTHRRFYALRAQIDILQPQLKERDDLIGRTRCTARRACPSTSAAVRSRVTET